MRSHYSGSLTYINIAITLNSVNENFQIIHRWLHVKRFILNESKSSLVVIGLNFVRASPAIRNVSIKINEQYLNEVSEAEFLGVTSYYTSQSPIEIVSTQKLVRKKSSCLVQNCRILLFRRKNNTAPKRIGDEKFRSGQQNVETTKLKV